MFVFVYFIGTRCPIVTCQTSSIAQCTTNDDCPCRPTSMEICCRTTTEVGCCVSVPLPLAILGISGFG